MSNTPHCSAKHVWRPYRIAREFANAGRPLSDAERAELDAAWDSWSEGDSFTWTRPDYVEGTANEVSVSFTPMPIQANTL